MAQDSPITVDMSKFQPLQSTQSIEVPPQPTAPLPVAASSNVSDSSNPVTVDMTKFQPLSGASTTTQSSSPASSTEDKIGNVLWGAVGLPGPEVIGALKGLAETGHTIGAYGSKLLNAAGVPVPKIPLESPEYLQAHGAEQSIGKVGEGILEFFLGDAALKGMSLTDKLSQATKLTELVEKYPTIAKALHIGVSALRMGAAGTSQALAHGAPVDQALESGGVTALAGGTLEGAQAVRAAEGASPLLKSAARVAELGTGAGFAAKGATDALTPQQSGETEQQATERRVQGGVQVVLGGKGVLDAAPKPGELAAKKAAQANREDFISARSDFKKAIPPSKSAPYEDHDIQVVNNYLEPHHQNVQPIRNVTDTIDALNHEIKGIDGKVRELIKIVPDEPIATNVLEDVRAGLEAVSNKKGFVDDGLKALEKYDLAKPTISQADSIRDELNDDNRAVMKKNAYDRSTARQTDPGFAASELAAKSLRDGVYGGLENHGVKGARDLRLDEGSLIKVRNAAEVQRFNGDKAVKGTGDTSLKKALGKAAITGATAATGGAVGSVAGPAGTGAGTVAGGIIGKELADRVLPTQDLTRDALIERRFGKIIATGEPTQPTVNLKQPEPSEPKGQQELLTDPSTLFDTGQSNLIPELTPLELAQAQSIREEPFQRVLNDPGATSGEKVRAKEQIRQLQNTPLPKGLVQRAEPLGPEKPSDEDLVANAAKALEERAAPYKAILNDPMATAVQKAVVHGELAKLYKQADKAAETASKEIKPPTATLKPAVAAEAPKDETSLFVRTQTPKAAGGSNAPLPAMSPEEHADIEKQAGRTLSNDEAQGYRLAKLNEKGAEETPKVDETKAIRQDNKEKMDKSDRHKKKAGAKALSGE